MSSPTGMNSFGSGDDEPLVENFGAKPKRRTRKVSTKDATSSKRAEKVKGYEAVSSVHNLFYVFILLLLLFFYKL